ncbi:MAG TPA: hypothetical protein VGS22_08030 [Thermoanaerobaculia bacterium]|nr:hypothetical protein [Thermoanaerobaculia bacterium]
MSLSANSWPGNLSAGSGSTAWAYSPLRAELVLGVPGELRRARLG